MDTMTPWRPNNRLLDDMPDDVCARLAGELRTVELPQGKVLYEAGAQQHQMYFPRSGIVSLLYDTEEGASGAIAIVGNEGMIGTALMIDGYSTPTRAVVQIAGEALTLRADVAEREFRLGNAFQNILLRYAQALIAQMAQTAICNRHHSIEQQLCRMLLLCVDRVGTDEFRMTQETIASVLGVRREGVTEAAGRLQQAALIRYSRGHIRVIDRDGLERRSCECYRAVIHEFDRLFPRPMPTSVLTASPQK